MLNEKLDAKINKNDTEVLSLDNASSLVYP